MHFRHQRRAAWQRMSPMAWTAAATLACMLGSTSFAFFLFHGDPQVVLHKALIATLIVPVFVGAPAYYVLIRRVRALNFRNLRLQYRVTRDGMTNCLNQSGFRKAVEFFLDHATRREDQTAALLIVDADRFKAINDSFGHDVGDEVIKLIANGLRSCLRARDLVGRLGGEEFGVLLKHADLVAAEQMAERIRQTIAQSEIPGADAAASVSVSLGGVIFNGGSFDALYRFADRKLYEAKINGRNQVRIGPFVQRGGSGPRDRHVEQLDFKWAPDASARRVA